MSPTFVKLAAVSAIALFMAAACGSKPATHKAPSESPTASPEDPDLRLNEALGPKAFSDGLGVVLRVVPLEPASDGAPRALINLAGVESPIAGYTFLSTRRQNVDGGDSWFVLYDGFERELLQTGAPVPEERVRVLPPRMRRRFVLRYDESASATIRPEQLIAHYQELRADKTLEKLEGYDREYRLASIQEQQEEVRLELVESCQSEIALDLDMSDIATKDLGSAAFCFVSASALAHICSKSPSWREDIVGMLKRIQCTGANKDTELEFSKGILAISGVTERTAVASMKAKTLSKILGLRGIVLAAQSGLRVRLGPFHAPFTEIHSGTGSTLNKQDVFPQSSSLLSRWLFHGDTIATLASDAQGIWKVRCRDEEVEFKELLGEKRKSSLAGLQLEGQVWQHEPFALARDDRGIYYYVDHLKEEFGGHGYRVFKGPRGNLALTKLVDIVSDANGMIFATSSGQLRLVIEGDVEKEARWLDGKKSTKLTVLDRITSNAFIYTELGVYDGQDLGRLCDQEYRARGAGP